MDEKDTRWAWAIGGSVVLVIAVLGAIVTLALADPAGDHTADNTLLLGLIPMVVVPLLALLKVADTGRDVRENKATTQATAKTVSELANGSMDAKIRLAVSQVVRDAMVDPEIHPQLAQDRRKLQELDQLAAELAARVRDE